MNQKKYIFVLDSHSSNTQGVHITNGQSALWEICSIKLFIMLYYEKKYDSTSTLQYNAHITKI